MSTDRQVAMRPAGPGDLDLLRRWDEQPHVIASGTDDWQWATELFRTAPWREMLIAELGGRAIGFLQIIDAATEENEPDEHPIRTQ